MPRRSSASTPRHQPGAKGAKRGHTSGLTATPVRPALFGTERDTALLLRLHRDGPCVGKAWSAQRLLKGGLVVRVGPPGRNAVWALDHRHPAFGEVLRVLDDLAGVRRRPLAINEPLPKHEMDRDAAFGHQNRAIFKVLYALATAPKPLGLETVIRRIPTHWRSTTTNAVRDLLASGILAEGEDGLRIADAVPTSYVVLVRRMGEHMGLHDNPAPVGPRPVAFMPATDGAPRLFATDARLRNFMALAKHGPLLVRELRRITGAGHLTLESYNVAQFGRGGVVRQWDTDQGPAVMLDRDHPLHLPLRRLLVALERVYPLPPFVARFKAPKPPPRRSWVGDRHALFGDIIPTMILTSIGVHGWTSEVLCDAVIHHDRLNIKRSMRRLEDEGVLQGHRPRGPGFNTRVVTIADGFPAKVELEALLRAYVRAWPGIATEVRRGFEKIARERPRGKVHLLRRGLWPY
jgi:hypothetical protein